MARGISVRIEVTGLEKPLAGLQNVRELGEDLLPFMQVARDVMRASVLERFRTGKGPFGAAWKPSRRAQGLVSGKPSGRTLVDTQDLQSSIRGEATSDYAEVGSDGLKNPIKALANQFGSKAQMGVKAHYRLVRKAFGVELAEPAIQYVRAHPRLMNLPARPFIGVDDQDVRQIDELWQDLIIRTFRNGQP